MPHQNEVLMQIFRQQNALQSSGCNRYDDIGWRLMGGQLHISKQSNLSQHDDVGRRFVFVSQHCICLLPEHGKRIV